MGGISHPDRQGWCQRCKRVVTALVPVREGRTHLICPGCSGRVPIAEP